MAFTRKSDNWSECMQGHSFFADLTQYTLQRRRNLATVTIVLRNHNIVYRWNYPAKLQITKWNDSFIISTMDEGLRLLREWEIITPLTLTSNDFPQHEVHPDTEEGWGAQQNVLTTIPGPRKAPLLLNWVVNQFYIPSRFSRSISVQILSVIVCFYIKWISHWFWCWWYPLSSSLYLFFFPSFSTIRTLNFSSANWLFLFF